MTKRGDFQNDPTRLNVKQLRLFISFNCGSSDPRIVRLVEQARKRIKELEDALD